jgi:hypothetical protein
VSVLLDDFDKELEAAVPPTEELELKKFTVQDWEKSPYKCFKLLRPYLICEEIAEAFQLGFTNKEIADATGVPEQAIAYTRNSLPMADLLEVHARRMINHMGTRNLEGESVSKIAFAAASLIEKSQLLKGQPTEIRRDIFEGTTERIRAAIFADTERTTGGGRIIDITPGEKSGELRAIADQTDPKRT